MTMPARPATCRSFQCPECGDLASDPTDGSWSVTAAGVVAHDHGLASVTARQVEVIPVRWSDSPQEPLLMERSGHG